TETTAPSRQSVATRSTSLRTSVSGCSGTPCAQIVSVSGDARMPNAPRPPAATTAGGTMCVWTSQPPVTCGIETPLLRRPANALQLDQPREIAHAIAIGELVHRTHLVDEHRRAERLMGHAFVAKNRFDLVPAPAKRDDDVRMIVNVEIDRLARIEIDLPDAHIFVLENDALPDFTKLDALLFCCFKSRLVGHG